MEREIIQISDGSGRIRIVGDPEECALAFDENPVAFRWSDCQGSIAQYLVRGTRAGAYQATLNQIRTLVSGVKPLPSMAETLRPLLQMFEPGQYAVCAREAVHSHVVHFSEQDDIRVHSAHYYPQDDVLICTQPREYLDGQVVADWIDFIQEGGRPLVLVTGLYKDESLFVLDGHHKLEAYRLANKEPHVIEIVRITTRSIALWEGEQAFGEAKALREEYRKFKENHLKFGGAEIPPLATGSTDGERD